MLQAEEFYNIACCVTHFCIRKLIEQFIFSASVLTMPQSLVLHTRLDVAYCQARIFPNQLLCVRSYFTILSMSILLKCFSFNVAKGRLCATAVAAINRSAMSICFRFFFKALFIVTATSTDISSRGIIVIACNTLSQNVNWLEVAPE
jgi:hypothetical protein